MNETMFDFAVILCTGLFMLVAFVFVMILACRFLEPLLRAAEKLADSDSAVRTFEDKRDE